MKVKLILFALFVAAVAIVPAQAATFYPGVVNIWEDNDYESVVNVAGGDPVGFDEGDIFFGIYQVQGVAPATDSTPPPSAEFTAVFAFEIDDISPGGIYAGGSRMTMAPMAFADADFDGFDDNWAALGLSRTDAGTMAVLYNDTDLTVTPDAAIPAALASATDGIMLWEVGFTGGGGLPGVNEFWLADTLNLTLGNIAFNYGASLNVTVQGAGPELVPHDWISTHPLLTPALWPTPPGGVLSQIQLVGGHGTHDPGEFAIPTDTDIFLMPVPEPGTAVIFFGLGAIALGWTWKRRRSA